jgi:hypothetical protein
LFQTTAIDCAGPLEVSQGPRRAPAKRYLLILTCVTYRAVNIQVLEDMSTDAFMLAMSRFFNAHARPKLIVSDNGSNFRKGNAVFQELFSNISDSFLRETYPNIKWTFGPAYAPYFTGIVERMVQKSKSAINAILAGARFSEQQLLTAATIAANFINNYPLSYELSSADEPLALTPNDFLHGNKLRDIAPNIPDTWDYAKRYKYLQETMDSYWNRFHDEIVPDLQKFHRHPQDGEGLEPGDVVILLDKQRRGEWALGRVMDSIRSKDGRIRKVEIFHNGKKVERHPRGLCKFVGRNNVETDINEQKTG